MSQAYEGWLPPKLSLEFYYAVCRCGFSCFQWCFWCYELYLTCSRWCSPKRRCCFVGSVWCYAKPRCYYSCPYCVMKPRCYYWNLDAIIRVHMVLCKTSMLLFVSIWCYAKPRCYYSCLYGVMRNLDAIIRVSNYVRLNPGLQRARPLWSGASDRLIMHILPGERKFMLPTMAEAVRK